MSSVAPISVHGPEYPANQSRLGLRRIENPKYYLDNGSQYSYPDAIDSENPPQSEMCAESCPPIPTSQIPQAASSSWGKINNFWTNYWKWILLGFAVLIILSVVSLVVILEVFKKEGHPVGPCKRSNFRLASPEMNRCWSIFDGYTTKPDSAVFLCLGMGARLVTIKSAEENALLQDFLGNSTDTWIGLHCGVKDASECRWDDATSLEGYSNFANESAVIGKCTLFLKASGLWISDACNRTSGSYVCEMNRIDK